MPLSAVLPRGRQKVKQEKTVFPYGISALSCRVFCARRSCSVGFCHGSAAPLMEGSPLGLHSSHQWDIVEIEVLPALAGPRWKSLSGY